MLRDKIKKSEPKEPEYSIPQLVVELFESRTQAHIEHLSTHSFAFHKATNKYYDAIVGLADDIAEAYTGLTSIPKYEEEKIKNTNFVEYLKTLYELCTKTQAKCEFSNIVNTIDEVKDLISSTLYKINNLK